MLSVRGLTPWYRRQNGRLVALIHSEDLPRWYTLLLASYSWLCHAPFDPYPLKLELNQKNQQTANGIVIKIIFIDFTILSRISCLNLFIGIPLVHQYQPCLLDCAVISQSLTISLHFPGNKNIHSTFHKKIKATPHRKRHRMLPNMI